MTIRLKSMQEKKQHYGEEKKKKRKVVELKIHFQSKEKEVALKKQHYRE